MTSTMKAMVFIVAAMMSVPWVVLSAPLKGITYSPFGPTAFCLTSGEVNRDLNIIDPLADQIRLYSIAACPDSTRQILSFAQQRGKKVLLGLWISKDTANNEVEINFLPQLLQQYSSAIYGVAVGNEVTSTEAVPISQLVGYLQRVRSTVKGGWPSIPVTTIEIWKQWETYTSTLVPLVDFVGLNMHPFFDGYPATCSGLGFSPCIDAPTGAVNKALSVQQLAGKPVVITETGWPSQGEPSGGRPAGFPSSAPPYLAVPSIPNSNLMLNGLTAKAKAAGIDYFYFESFDGGWKRTYVPCQWCQLLQPGTCLNNFCTYDYYWGLFTQDRVAKVGITLPGNTPPPVPAAPPAVVGSRLKGLAYSPFGATAFCLTSGEVNRDLNVIGSLTDKFRLYSIAACPDSTRQILSFAQQRGKKVLLGLWISKDTANNEVEINFLPQLLQQYASAIYGVAVGNEVTSTEAVPISQLVGYLQRVRSTVKGGWPSIPVTTIEIWKQWETYTSTLVPLVDFVGLNMHPFFDGYPATCSGLGFSPCIDAPTGAVNKALSVQQLAGKPVVITETGWPSQGEPSGGRPAGFPSSAPSYLAVPSIPNSNYYVNAFSLKAGQSGLDYFFFESFDGGWKRTYVPCQWCQLLQPGTCLNNYCTYDYYWGLFTQDRVSKVGITIPTGQPSTTTFPPPPPPTSSPKASPPPPPPSSTPKASPPPPPPGTSPKASPPPPPPSSGPSGSQVVIGGVTYVYPGTVMDFNSLATQNKGCPSGYVFSSYTGNDAQAAHTLAGPIRLWVMENTVGGRVPIKPAGGTAIDYISNSDLPQLPFICKGTAPLPSGSSKPPPPPPSSSSPSLRPPPPPSSSSPSALPSGYTLITTPITAFQDCFSTCQSKGLRFVSYQSPSNTKPNDVTAVNAALKSVSKVYVNDNTVGGQCPTVATSGSVVLENCFQNIAFVCGPN